MQRIERRWVWAVGGSIGLVAIICLLLFRGGSLTPPQTTANSVQFTDAITGAQSQDLPFEQSQTLSIPTTSAAINGSDALGNYLTDSQASAAEDDISNFLLAHSGLANVESGIQDEKITQVDSQTIRFIVVVVRPTATYQVTIHVPTQTQASQVTVSLEPMEQQ